MGRGFSSPSNAIAQRPGPPSKRLDLTTSRRGGPGPLQRPVLGPALSYGCQGSRPFGLRTGPTDLSADPSPPRQQLVVVQERDKAEPEVALDSRQPPPLHPDEDVAIARLDQSGHDQGDH